jgi:hypothetical protein
MILGVQPGITLSLLDQIVYKLLLDLPDRCIIGTQEILDSKAIAWAWCNKRYRDEVFGVDLIGITVDQQDMLFISIHDA